MSAVLLDFEDKAVRMGLKGPRAVDWLQEHGAQVPAHPNSWRRAPFGVAQRLLVARLGYSEVFLEDDEGSGAALALIAKLAAEPEGVYPVLREDCAFRISGAGAHDVLAQVCNLNFADIDLQPRTLVMTLMIGVAVLAIPEGADETRIYRFWCDPTFGPSLSEKLRTVVADCGGTTRGVSA